MYYESRLVTICIGPRIMQDSLWKIGFLLHIFLQKKPKTICDNLFDWNKVSEIVISQYSMLLNWLSA